jgi:hypothetical protein
MHIDVFNGDADGIFSLIQLRKVKPLQQAQQRLITGVKRDISLVQNITDTEASGADITVLDISFDKNVADVQRVLKYANSLFYCDHHQADKIFNHEKLATQINTQPDVCTALLINDHLAGEQALWAVAAAFGDGLDNAANKLANQLGLNDNQKMQLKQLGVLVNYNGYGAQVADLFFPPDTLYRQLIAYDDPFAVLDDAMSPYAILKQGYDNDLAQARRIMPLESTSTIIAVKLDSAPWAGRISGTYGNVLAAENPTKAVVIASSNVDGSLTISLRAPKNNPYGAAAICSKFPTGGGREGAAGVNALPANDLPYFISIAANKYG